MTIDQKAPGLIGSTFSDAITRQPGPRDRADTRRYPEAQQQIADARAEPTDLEREMEIAAANDHRAPAERTMIVADFASVFREHYGPDIEVRIEPTGGGVGYQAIARRYVRGSKDHTREIRCRIEASLIESVLHDANLEKSAGRLFDIIDRMLVDAGWRASSTEQALPITLHGAEADAYLALQVVIRAAPPLHREFLAANKANGEAMEALNAALGTDGEAAALDRLRSAKAVVEDVAPRFGAASGAVRDAFKALCAVIAPTGGA